MFWAHSWRHDSVQVTSALENIWHLQGLQHGHGQFLWWSMAFAMAFSMGTWRNMAVRVRFPGRTAWFPRFGQWLSNPNFETLASLFPSELLITQCFCVSFRSCYMAFNSVDGLGFNQNGLLQTLATWKRWQKHLFGEMSMKQAAKLYHERLMELCKCLSYVTFV